jgi:serine phosphatase RsbU (regulator of sigma subunit)
LEHGASTALLDELTQVLPGAPTLHLVRPDGETVRRAGPDDGTLIRNRRQGIVIEPGPGRTSFHHEISASGQVAVLSFDSGHDAAVRPFLQHLFATLDQKNLFEEDMESMQPSSLALMEQVAAYNWTLPKLSTGGSEAEIAEMGLEALVVAAGIRRTLYLRYDQVAEQCEVLVQVGIDAAGRKTVRIPYDGPAILQPDDGIVWRAIRGSGEAILESASPGGRLGLAHSPEFRANGEVIAVPVAFDSGDKRVVLGVVLAMDKRNAYASADQLGSRETEFATAIASMLGSVLGARKAAELRKELHLAKEIQRQILPDRPAQIAGFDLAGRCANATTGPVPDAPVGGDYFDFLPMQDGRTLVVVADVSGHNLASGLLMVSARSALRAIASKHTSPGVVFDDLARALYDDLHRTELFITAVGATLTPGQSRVELVNAGHNDSMIYRRATGRTERIASESTIFGFLPDSRHEQTDVELAEGDVMLLYTDGVVEATNPAGEMLGEGRLAALLADIADGTAEEILAGVFKAVEEYSSRSMRGDDITAVVVKALPPQR